jgi:subtilisin family serine protease
MKIVMTFCLALCLAVSTVTAQVIPDQYIVVLKDDAPAAKGREIASQHGVQVGHEYSVALKGFSFNGSAKAAAAIAKNPNVAYVEADVVAKASAQTLTAGVDRMEIDLNAIANIDGVDDRVNVDVAVLDTGIDVDHPDLPAVVGGRHFYSITYGRPSSRGSFEDNNYDDDEGHGTHVAGTIAALDNSIGVVGVVPGARLWAVKVLDSSGSGSFSDVIKGIDWVTANADQIEVANMSLSGQGSLASLRTALQNSVAAGVVFVVAASNDSLDVYGQDATFGTNDDIIPAAYPEVMTVSAMGDTDGQAGGSGADTSRYTGDDTFADFTNYSSNVTGSNPVTSPGAAIDVAGPGVDILSTYPGGGYATASGTSMASPHVAGLVALEIATNGRANNAADVYAIRQVIIDSAQAQADWGPANTQDPDTNAEGLAVAASGPVNDAPSVSISAPGDNAVYASGATVNLSGVASDTEDGTISAQIAWSSDIDGSLGSGASTSAVLSDGQHIITASITDSGSKTRTASVSVTVGDPPDFATISSVDSISYSTFGGNNANKNLQISLVIRDDFGAPVVSGTVEISLSRNGSPIATGSGITDSTGSLSFNLRNASSGTYVTTVTDVQATDLTWDGNTPANSFVK